MTTVDKTEIEKFSKMAEDWWNPNGKFKPLHQLTPARVKFIRDKLISHFTLNPNSEKPLEKLKILDVGCGNGETLIEHLIKRLKRSKRINKIIVKKVFIVNHSFSFNMHRCAKCNNVTNR